MPKNELVTKINLTRPGASAGGGGTVIAVTSGGSGGGAAGGNADLVDGLHAAVTPLAGQLLALNASAQFPASTIPDISATYAPTTRQVIAGDGLTGGGALSGDVTLAIGTPGTLTSSTTNSVTADSHVHAVVATSSPTDASLIKGDANGKVNFPALDIGAMTGATAGRLYVQKSLVLGVEDGPTLPGVTGRAMRLFVDNNGSRGHVLAYNYTTNQPLPLNLQNAGGNLLVGAWSADMGERLQVQGAVRLAYASDVTKYATLSVGSGGNLTLAPTGGIVFNPSGTQIDPQTPYALNLGSPNKKYLTLHAAELWVNTLVAQQTLGTIGGRVMVGPTTELIVDLSASGNASQGGVTPATGYTYARVKHNCFDVYDIALMEADGKVEFFRTENHPAADSGKCYKTIGAGDYEYYLARNLDASGANAWYAGDALFNTGSQGEGFIDLYSVRGVANASSAGPTLLMNVRSSNAYNGWVENAGLGNLKGIYGYATDTYGVAFGQYLSAAWVTADATNGIRILQGASATQLSRWFAQDEGNYKAGDVLIGADTGANLLLSAGEIALRNTTNTMIRLTASPPRIDLAGWMTLADGAGGIYQGTYQAGHDNDPGYPETGLKLWGETDFYYNVIGKFGVWEDGVEKLEIGATGLSLHIGDESGQNVVAWHETMGDEELAWIDVFYNAAGTELYMQQVARSKDYAEHVSLQLAALASANPTRMADWTLFAGDAAGDTFAELAINGTVTLHADTTGVGLGNSAPAEKLHVTGNAQYTGDLKPYRNSTAYTGYVYVPLATPLTSTDWNGNAKTAASSGTLDLSSVFGAPAGIKAVSARLAVRHSAADARASLRTSSGVTDAVTARTQAANLYVSDSGIVPCDANGDIYFSASGNIDNVFLEITGYFI